MLDSAHGFLSKGSRTQLTAVSCLLIAIVGAVDYATGYEVSFSIFYLVPVSVAAWYATDFLPIAACGISAATWFMVDITSGHEYTHPAIAFWNAIVRLGFFVIVALLLARLRDALADQRALAQRDALTGILNSRAFLQYCEPLTGLAARNRLPIALGFLDLDGFKGINDSLGHHTGDIVLKSVATAIAGRLRASDVVGRMGGDEFAILLPETDLAGARTFFGNTREALLGLAALKGWAVGFSIGVAVFRPPATSLDDAIRCADRLMYRAKRTGENSVILEEYSNAGDPEGTRL